VTPLGKEVKEALADLGSGQWCDPGVSLDRPG
jgi:hypothetical protein